MRLLVALTYYHPHWTGLTAYAQRLAEGLARRGHSVTVLTSRFDRRLPADEVYNGVQIIRLPVAVRLSRGVVMPTFATTAWRLIQTHDVVQIHTPMLEAWLTMALARRAARPVLMTHHGDLVMPAGAFNQIVERTVTWTMLQAQRQVARVSVHSEDYARASRFLAPSRHKQVYIYPPVDLPAPDLVAARAWQAELGLGDAAIVSFAGRFVEEKGFDILLRAIPLVRAHVPNVCFAYAGQTNIAYEHFFDRWRHLVEANRDTLVMIGLLRDPQRLAQFYAMSHVLALPSRTDCFPSVQIEALRSGTPVVASDIPGAREPVQLTGMGLLVRPEDPEALAQGLVKVIRQRERYVRPPDKIRATFDPERACAEYGALLESLRQPSRLPDTADAYALRPDVVPVASLGGVANAPGGSLDQELS